MRNLNTLKDEYLLFCQNQKCLDEKTLKAFFHYLEYKDYVSSNPFSKNDYQYKNTLRDIAVIELLFATGMRISELCSLSPVNVNLINRTVLIYKKGSRERSKRQI